MSDGEGQEDGSSAEVFGEVERVAQSSWRIR
jgi:hypothetical protein